MAKSINEIMSNLGISGSSGYYDHEAAERATEEKDTRKFTKGGKDSAPDDPRIGTEFPTSAERNLERAREAGLAPPIADPMITKTEQFRSEQMAAKSRFSDKQDQVKRLKKGKTPLIPLSDKLYSFIRGSEMSPSDFNNRTMTAYFEKGRKGKNGAPDKPPTFNIGPGLNLSSPLVRDKLKAYGFDAEELKGQFDYINKEVVPPEMAEVFDKVFKDVVKAAAQDAISHFGASVWKKLKVHEQEALIDLSYNNGALGLSKWTGTRDVIAAMVKNRNPDTLKAVRDELADSDMYRAGGGSKNRIIKIQDLFTQKQDSTNLRNDAWFRRSRVQKALEKD